jgi:hypothetical protein
VPNPIVVMAPRTFQGLAIGYEPKIRKLIQKMWPALKYLLDNSKKTLARKKKVVGKRYRAPLIHIDGWI